MDKIIKTLVPENKRMDFLPKFCGKYFMQFENMVYDDLRKMCKNYDGGLWEFYTLSNGGFYMALEQDEPLELECYSNYYKGSMSAEAGSIAINLFALNGLAWHLQPEKFSEYFHLLRDFALEHKEAKEIMKFID